MTDSTEQYTIQPVTRRFILDPSIVSEIKQKTPQFGFNGLGEVVFRRTYSRDGEDWHDVVIRVVEGVMSIRFEHYFRNSLYWDEPKWQQFAREMALSMFDMEWLPPGRGLWMMGTEFTYNRGGMSLNNCSATDTAEDLVLSAEWTMDALMNGVGVGFTTNWRGTATKPNKQDSELYVIPDSREGWITSLIKLMCSYIHSPRYGKNKFPIFDYSLIRPAGQPIKGFGGLASGPDPLKKLHARVEGYLDSFCEGKIPCYEQGDDFKLKEVEGKTKSYNHTRLVADIFNAIGACVVAGNVRRCLPGDAMVHTKDGLIPIKDVEIGQKVLTSKGYHNITNKFIQGEQKLVKIVTQDGDFRCTPNHRMAVCTSYNTYEWKKAGDLVKGDRLISNKTSTENWFTPVEVTEVVDDCSEQTFDIEVENMHEFFCNGYLTHNSAEICLGDVENDTFINLKNYNEHPERAEIGWMSNNSVVLHADRDYEDFSYIPDMAARIRDNGEPGMINLYNIQKYGRFGKEMKDDASMVNPCFSGDMLVAVADGRGCVPIKTLAEQGKDVPLYSIDPVTGDVSIKWGRHPRVTGENKRLVRIHFNGSHKGQFIDVTPEHKIILNDGREVEAQELKKGDSLPMFQKKMFSDGYIRINVGGKKYHVEHRMIKKFYSKNEFYENYQEGVYNGCCRTDGVVIHHKDEDKTNNHPDNLEVTTASEHNRIHNQEYVGEGNPMYGKQHSEETKNLISQKAKERCSDPAYRKRLSDAQTPEMREKSSLKMKAQKAEWDEKVCDDQEEEAKRVGLKVIRISPTTLRVVRVCENSECKQEFRVKWTKREQAYCSKSCSNTKKTSIEARKRGQASTFESKAKENFHKQAMVYKDLVEKKGVVMKKEWEQECRTQGISYRFNRKTNNPWIAQGWKEFKQMVDDHNHRVSHIEFLDGKHTVYNITVDDNHTLAIVTKTKDKNSNLVGVFTKQCGEIPLENFELCNLAETFPPRCKNADRFYKAIEYATFYASTVSLLPTHRPETNAVIARNRRIGVSISGIAQWASGEISDGWGNMNYTRMTTFLREAYRIVRERNTHLAREAGVPASVRVTTVKPSGSISLLTGVTPGVHYPVSRYAIRRMRIGNDSPLVQPLIDAGIPHEPDTYSDNTMVFEFTIDHGQVRPCEQVSPWEQFALVAMMQKHYADNCVSATIYFDKDKDGADVEKMLAAYIPLLKSVSMLPHSGHGYAQAPYEPISYEEYERRRNAYGKPDFSAVSNNVPIGSKYCSGDKCEFALPEKK